MDLRLIQIKLKHIEPLKQKVSKMPSSYAQGVLDTLVVSENLLNEILDFVINDFDDRYKNSMTYCVGDSSHD